MNLSRNIELSKLSKQLYSLINEEINTFSEQEQQYIWNKLFSISNCKELIKVRQPENTGSPMDYEEARNWYRNSSIEFGKYKGYRVIDIPLDYLLWLDDQPDFRVNLHRFLQSEYWKTTHGAECE